MKIFLKNRNIQLIYVFLKVNVTLLKKGISIFYKISYYRFVLTEFEISKDGLFIVKRKTISFKLQENYKMTTLIKRFHLPKLAIFLSSLYRFPSYSEGNVCSVMQHI